MWERMKEPWLIKFTIITLIGSGGLAQFFVNVLGWRYTDWTGINSQPFDASSSVLAYTVMGALGWPLLALAAWLLAYEASKAIKRSSSKVQSTQTSSVESK